MRLEVNGVQYTNFVSASCELRLDSLSSAFSFNAVAPEGQAMPFKGGEACKVIVDNEPVLTGFIEVVDVDYSGSDHTITVSGRDKTADLLDSTIDVINDIRGDGLTLKELIEKVIDHLGLDIKVIDQVNPDPFNATEDIAAPEPSDNAFDFIEKYSRKRHVLLTSNADGNVVITANSGVNAEGAVQHVIGAEDNNVINASFSYDTTGRYNNYKLTSSLNPVALNQAGDTDLASVVSQSDGVSDPDIRKGRQMVIISENPFSKGSCRERAKWEADIRRARGLIYSATVPLYRVDGEEGDLWQINKVYRVVDDYIGKIEPMLCNSIIFSLSDEGRNTELGFVGQNAYKLFIEPDSSVSEASNVT